MKKLILGLLISLLSIASFSQDTTRLESIRQEVKVLEMDSTVYNKYTIVLYKNGEDKMLAVYGAKDTVVYIADTYMGADQSGDSTILYYVGRRISPTKANVNMGLLGAGENFIAIGISDGERLIMFFIEPKQSQAAK